MCTKLVNAKKSLEIWIWHFCYMLLWFLFASLKEYRACHPISIHSFSLYWLSTNLRAILNIPFLWQSWSKIRIIFYNTLILMKGIFILGKRFSNRIFKHWMNVLIQMVPFHTRIIWCTCMFVSSAGYLNFKTVKSWRKISPLLAKRRCKIYISPLPQRFINIIFKAF